MIVYDAIQYVKYTLVFLVHKQWLNERGYLCTEIRVEDQYKDIALEKENPKTTRTCHPPIQYCKDTV